MDAKTDTTWLSVRQTRPISASLIVLAGATFALVVLVVSFFVNCGFASFSGSPLSKLPEWVDAETSVYCQWGVERDAAAVGLPGAQQGLLETAAKALRTTPEAIEAAWAHVRGVEVALPALGCVHFESSDYLASWLTEELGLKDPMLCRGHEAYRVAAELFVVPLGKTLLVAPSLSHVETTLGRMAAEAGDSLADDERFRLAARAHDRAGLGWAYFQPAGLLNAAAALSQRVEPRSVPGILFGLASARPSAAQLDLATDYAVVSATVFGAENHGASREPSHWLGLRNAGDKSLLRFVPGDAEWFLALSVETPAAFWSGFRQWASEAGPKRGLRSEIELELARLEAAYTVDIKNEIVPRVAHEIALFSTGPSEGDGAGGLVIAAELSSVKDTLITLARMEGGPELRNTKYENQTFKGKAMRVAELDEGLSYAAVDGCLLASRRVHALRAAISAAHEGPNMASRPKAAVGRAYARAARECALVAGVNSATLAGLLKTHAPAPGFIAVVGVAGNDRLSLTAVIPRDTGRTPAAVGQGKARASAPSHTRRP